MAFGESDVVERVEAMLADARVCSPRIEFFFGGRGWISVFATMGSVLFVHHWLAAILGYYS